MKGIPGSHFQTLIGGSWVQLSNFKGWILGPKVPLPTVLASLLHHANLFYKAINFEVLKFSQIGVYKRIPTEKIFYCEKSFIKSIHPELFTISLQRCSVEKLEACQENIQCAVFVLVKLMVNYLEKPFDSYITPPRMFCSRCSERFQNCFTLFFYQRVLSQTLIIYGAAVKGRKPSSFLCTTSNRS